MNTFTAEAYLIVGQRFSERGFQIGKPSVRITKLKPTLDAHEVAVFLRIELPQSLFVRPALSATVRVPESQAPAVITPDVMSNIAEVIQERLGITLEIRAP